MPWNPSPAVAVARDAAQKLGNKPMTIIIHIDEDKGQIGYASYGATKALCGRAKQMADIAYNAIVAHYQEEADGTTPRNGTAKDKH